MKKFILTLLMCLGAIGYSKEAYATHAAAGEITYQWVSDSTYRFYFTLYRDCSGVVEDDTIRLCFNNPCNVSTNFTVLFNKMPGQNGIAMPGCPLSKSTCDDIFNATYSGFKQWIYSGLVTMPARCSTWKVSAWVQQRNTNVNFQGMFPFYAETMMNNMSPYQGNSSPSFSAWPIAYVCVYNPSGYNNGAVDKDGDSLATELIMPRSAAGNCTVTPSNAQFISTTPFLGFPFNPFQTNNSFNLDPSTGMMTFTPQVQYGNSLTARIKEYRNGVLISYVDREMQLQIYNCNLKVPTFNISTPGPVKVCVGQTINLCWYAKANPSANFGTKLVVEDDHAQSLPSSTVLYQLQGSDSVRGCLNWTPGINDKGWHNLNILIKDSTCNGLGVIGRYYYNVRVYVVGSGFASADTSVCPGTAVQLTSPNGTTAVWSVISGMTNSLSCNNCSNPVATPKVTTKYQVTLGGVIGCASNKDTVTISVLPFKKPSVTISANPDTNILAGTTVTFIASTVNCNNPSYQWRRNGAMLPGATSATWSSATLNNQDVITVKIQCKDTCIIDTPSNKLTMHIGTGIRSAASNKVILQPNPNNGEFVITGYIGGEVINIDIVNGLGQVVFRQHDIATINGYIDHKLNTGNISNGNYTVRIITSDRVFTQNMTIRR